MNYEQIEKIKNELESTDVSLLMLKDLKVFIDNKIESWGKESGKQYRIF